MGDSVWREWVQEGSRTLARGGLLLCEGCGRQSSTGNSDGMAGGGDDLTAPLCGVSMALNVTMGPLEATAHAPLGFACRWLPELGTARHSLLVVNPAVDTPWTEEAEPGEEAHEDAVVTRVVTGDTAALGPGSCQNTPMMQAAHPHPGATRPEPWSAHTFVISTGARLARWQDEEAAENGHVTLVPALHAIALPQTFLDAALETIVKGIEDPPLDRAYAAHSTAVMLGHLAAWEQALARLQRDFETSGLGGLEGASRHSTVSEQLHAAVLQHVTILEDDASRTPAYGHPPLPTLVAELAAHDPSWDLIVLNDPPPQKLAHTLTHPSHAPELTAEELEEEPRQATAHLLRIPPCTKAVAWVLSRRFLERLLRAQRRRPYYGPVDVWAWRVRHSDDGDPVHVYAPLVPWFEEDDACTSHQAGAHQQTRLQSTESSAVPSDLTGGGPACRANGLPQVAREWCEQQALR